MSSWPPSWTASGAPTAGWCCGTHTIPARVPRLFDGRLPELNLGTFSGGSCAPGLQVRLEDALEASGRRWVANGRFKGGYITRHYGAPSRGVHAVQMEQAQASYMVEAAEGGPAWSPARAAAIQPTLRSLLETAIDWARHG